MYTFSVNPEKWSFMLVWAGYFQWVGIKCVLFHFVFLLWEPKIIAYMFSWFSRQDNHKVYINQHHDHLRLHKLPTFLPSTHLLTHPHIPFLMQPNVAFFYSGIIAIKNCGQFHKGCKKNKKFNTGLHLVMFATLRDFYGRTLSFLCPFLFTLPAIQNVTHNPHMKFTQNSQIFHDFLSLMSVITSWMPLKNKEVDSQFISAHGRVSVEHSHPK